jgi:hypothetical protein
MILARSASRWLDLGRLVINVSFSFSAGSKQSLLQVFLLALPFVSSTTPFYNVFISQYPSLMSQKYIVK